MRITKKILAEIITEVLEERKLTKKEKAGLKKMEKSVPKKEFEKQYGKEEGEKIYYATLTKQAKKKY
jgi:hypothetical protein